ncbi:glycosyltransferase involved in cell wall biosynthesis [Wenyingzhuangia heitensis]|uniref:Glycosyltransferase involved in cell wall biosynthesis n=1 Tax=Wenyingzhuangia heitensis TaxID=1487859 RepID=A0ABX0UDB1_9FLAO|nr:GT4 family glycosyltransferase PelF [Wenyingzhuangia heitensis]NIJ45461.1 glycosyltransferase involved in cell wall biosynthesis [Wenyingzhuangia heitensis]
MRKSVMLVGEGNYPFMGGGVSTWCHSICTEVSEVDFSILSFTADVSLPIYELPKNVISVKQVPLWSVEEPIELLRYNEKYFDRVLKKERTKSSVVRNQFIPLFDQFIKAIFSKEEDTEYLLELLIQLYTYFKKYDYKDSMYSIEVWDHYKGVVGNVAEDDTYISKVKISDIVTSLRWIYRFLLPITVDLDKTDINHVTISGFPFLPVIIAKHKYKTPIVLTEHGVFMRERLINLSASPMSYFLKSFLINFSELVTKMAYKSADVVVSVNTYNLKWAQMYGADPKKCKVIYNGVDENKFVPKPKPLKHKDTKVVVAAARIFELKDILTMIRSCAEVKKEIPNVKYIVYGNKDAVPEYTTKCEELIIELELEEYFILAGLNTDPPSIFVEGDISILTSISEGFPYTIIESMSCGVPVVATDVGGVKEAIDDGVDGFVCKPKDYKAIAEKVIILLKNEDLRKEMAQKSREKVVNNFTIEVVRKAYSELYKSL